VSDVVCCFMGEWELISTSSVCTSRIRRPGSQIGTQTGEPTKGRGRGASSCVKGEGQGGWFFSAVMAYNVCANDASVGELIFYYHIYNQCEGI
jgi:hypothetical protein